MDAKILIFMLFVIIAAAFTYVFFTSEKNLDMEFIVDQTKEHVDGDVYMNGVFMGSTKDGRIYLEKKNLAASSLVFVGSYQGKEFNISYNLGEAGINSNNLDFTVPYNQIIFDASELDASSAEREIFNLVNQNRLGNPPLRYNSKIAAIARYYSNEMVQGGFSHTDPQGRDVSDRLQENRVFYLIAGENLFYIGGVDINTTEDILANKTVTGWLGSPGHRSLVLDRDGLYSDAGVGVHCEKTDCYVTLVLVGLLHEYNYKMKGGYCNFHWIYDTSFPFNYTAPVSMRINSTHPINTYLVADEKEIENCASRMPINSIKDWQWQTEIQDSITAKRGYVVIIETNVMTDVSVKLDFRS